MKDFSEMYFIDADFFMVPSYRVSPFRTEYLSKNQAISSCNGDLASVLQTKYNNLSEISITSGGREAIDLALRDLSLDKNSIVTILTPSNNKYVSSCVTTMIEKYCKWNREVTDATSVLFVIHEFGKIYSDMDMLSKLNLPIIEDYAHAFLSTPKHSIQSDYLIISFPKSFPIQYGGALLAKKKIRNDLSTSLNNKQINYIKNVISFYLENMSSLVEKQKLNYLKLESMFNKKSISARFDYEKNEVPSVFMFNLPMIYKGNLKEKLQQNGVECSFFYGENAFFIPVNYNMSELDLIYLYNLVFKFMSDEI